MRPTRVLKNIVKLLKYRKYAGVPKYKDLIGDFNKALVAENQYTFSVNDVTVSIAFREVKKNLTSFGEFMRPLTSKQSNAHIIAAVPAEIDDDLIASYIASSKTPIAVLEVFPFTYLAMNYPKRVNIPIYEIIPKDQVPELLNELRIEDTRYLSPMYRSGNVYTYWLGAYPGDVVREKAFTEKALIEIHYYTIK